MLSSAASYAPLASTVDMPCRSVATAYMTEWRQRQRQWFAGLGVARGTDESPEIDDQARLGCCGPQLIANEKMEWVFGSRLILEHPAT